MFKARQWISQGNGLLSALTADSIGEMDAVTCEETIKQLSSFCASKEQNLVLKGNPSQFRKQFSDLLNSEMKVCEPMSVCVCVRACAIVTHGLLLSLIVTWLGNCHLDLL